ncbi:copper homeostasis protein CutC [Streptomyces carpinensis]|uniref:PF03932 family protein CutC n=1 Tax=Streptomyces carpinensis TaxID=66369 RepID=A0ABV1W9T9_9ACTN|nr:copper homeostasis protein CutC [Streptomyces carpinensis]
MPSGSPGGAGTSRAALEIAVTSPAGARAAREHGADRVELSTGLELGGLTPSAASVEAVTAVGLPVQALVRCRPGDFVYEAEEIALMVAEVRSVVASGASGVVVGALTTAGSLDIDAVTRLADAAHDAARNQGRSIDVTLHRAIDQSADPAAAAALLPALGITRVLTSGGAATAAAGLATLASMVAAAPGVQVMAGGGVRTTDIPALVTAGVAAVHLSAKARAEARRGGAWIPLGVSGTSALQDTHFVTDPQVVAEARQALDGTDKRAPGLSQCA